MATPEMSDAVTQGIRVGAAAFYLPDESEPDDRKYLFGYTIVIANVGEAPAQLISRHWVIIDAQGRREEVRGPGVVGETPRLEPGQAFKYQSHCPLKTPWGTMEGTYQMRRDDGEMFDARIERFYLRVPVREEVQAK
jgi:ApaG protein